MLDETPVQYNLLEREWRRIEYKSERVKESEGLEEGTTIRAELAPAKSSSSRADSSIIKKPQGRYNGLFLQTEREEDRPSAVTPGKRRAFGMVNSAHLLCSDEVIPFTYLNAFDLSAQCEHQSDCLKCCLFSEGMHE